MIFVKIGIRFIIFRNIFFFKVFLCIDLWLKLCIICDKNNFLYEIKNINIVEFFKI